MIKRIICLILSLSILLFYIIPVFAILAKSSSWKDDINRYTVLLIDRSDSLIEKKDNIPNYYQRSSILPSIKSAAIKFVNITANSPRDFNYIALVTFGVNAIVASEFKMINRQNSSNYNELIKSINSIEHAYSSNFNVGFEKAKDLIEKEYKHFLPDSDDQFNIILFSDGLPNYGETLNDYKYCDYDYKYYKEANQIVFKADNFKKKKNCFIYSYRVNDRLLLS